MKSRSLSFLTLFFVTLVILASVTETAEAQRRRAVTRHNITFGSLSGIVTDAATAEPLGQVRVTVQNKTVTTNDDGEYEFEQVATGNTISVVVKRFGYQEVTRVIEIIEGENIANFALDLLPFAVLTRVDGTTERFAVDTIKYGYVIPFTGRFDSAILSVCTGNPDEPIGLESSDIAMVLGPSTRVETSCCSKFAGEQVTIQLKDGSMFDAVILDSCPPYNIFFSGFSLDRNSFLSSPLSETESISYPQ